MNHLILVRHAQASLHKEDYDQLSDLGHKQARALGDWLANVEQVEQVYCGPLKRQRQTLERVYEELDLLGIRWPEPVFLNQLEEHQGPKVMRALMPSLVQTDPLIRQWREQMEVSNGNMHEIHLRMFDYVMQKWASDQLDDQHLDLPSWAEFVEKVQQGLDYMRANSIQDSTIIAFTSSGTISAAIGQVLGISTPARVIGLNGWVYNTGMAEFVFSDQQITMKAFNSVPHLSRKELLTYV